MMAVLKERRLGLSRKKTRIGRIETGFHFLGINYPGTQTSDNTDVTQATERSVIQPIIGQNKTELTGGGQVYQRIINYLCWNVSSRIQGHYEKHASMF